MDRGGNCWLSYNKNKYNGKYVEWLFLFAGYFPRDNDGEEEEQDDNDGDKNGRRRGIRRRLVHMQCD